jgi:hypothetical protein
MFAKLARFSGFGRRHALLSAAKTAYANDNHPGRRTAASPRARRQTLVCGWRHVPATGRLECFWQVEPAGAAVAEEPGISRTTRRHSSASARHRVYSDCRGSPLARPAGLGRVRPIALAGRSRSQP